MGTMKADYHDTDRVKIMSLSNIVGKQVSTVPKSNTRQFLPITPKSWLDWIDPSNRAQCF